jgi:hypothetical protein
MKRYEKHCFWAHIGMKGWFARVEQRGAIDSLIWDLFRTAVILGLPCSVQKEQNTVFCKLSIIVYIFKNSWALSNYVFHPIFTMPRDTMSLIEIRLYYISSLAFDQWLVECHYLFTTSRAVDKRHVGKFWRKKLKDKHSNRWVIISADWSVMFSIGISMKDENSRVRLLLQSLSARQ